MKSKPDFKHQTPSCYGGYASELKKPYVFLYGKHSSVVRPVTVRVMIWGCGVHYYWNVNEHDNPVWSEIRGWTTVWDKQNVRGMTGREANGRCRTEKQARERVMSTLRKWKVLNNPKFEVNDSHGFCTGEKWSGYGKEGD